MRPGKTGLFGGRSEERQTETVEHGWTQVLVEGHHLVHGRLTRRGNGQLGRIAVGPVPEMKMI